jgi:hypothetical protein
VQRPRGVEGHLDELGGDLAEMAHLVEGVAQQQAALGAVAEAGARRRGVELLVEPQDMQ